jgi:hypothetical protein
MLIITIIISGYFSGAATLLQKSAYIAEKAEDVNTSVNAYVISLFHLEGDQVVLSSLGSANRIPVSFLLISPNATSHTVPRSSLTVDPAKLYLPVTHSYEYPPVRRVGRRRCG